MTKLFTKFASLLAAFALIVSMTPMSVFAQTVSTDMASTSPLTSIDTASTSDQMVTVNSTDGTSTTTTTTDTSTSTAPTTQTTTSNLAPESAAQMMIFPCPAGTTGVFPACAPIPAPTPTTVTVSSSTPNGWSTYGLAAGGTASFVTDSSAPLGNGALQLVTADDVNSVTHYSASANLPVTQVTQISYQSKQISAKDATNGNATLRLGLDLDGDNQVDDQIMYEPAYNGFHGGTNWNTWTITQSTGKFWSNWDQTYNGHTPGAAGSDTSDFTLSDVLASYPNAKIVSYIFSMGDYNAAQTVNVDDLHVTATTQNTTYDFEPEAVMSNQVLVVTPSNLQGWGRYSNVDLQGDASTTATSTFVADAGSPLPPGALQLSTPATSDEVLFDHSDATMTPVSNINLSYATKRVSGAADAASAYVLGIDKDGSSATTNDTLYAYYEPTYNGGSNYDNWNTWQVGQTSKYWSFQTVGTKGGAQGSNFFTLQDVKNAYPNAKVNEYSINQGTGNTGWVTNVDAVVTPTATYNFEQDPSATTNNGGADTRTVGGGGGGGGGSNFSSGNGSSGTTSTTGGSTTTTSTTGGQVLGASTYHFVRDLHTGLRGADVTELQTELIAAGYLKIQAATGYFGALTRAAVAMWQAEHSIAPAAGYFGPISRAKHAFDGGFHFLTVPVTTTSTTTTAH